MPEGSYIIGSTITVKQGSLTIRGEGDGTRIIINEDVKAFNISNLSTNRLIIKDICFEGTGKETALSLGERGLCLNVIIDNCVFKELYNAILLSKEVDNLTIENCYFLRVNNGIYCKDISVNKSVVRIRDNHFQMQKKWRSFCIYGDGVFVRSVK